MEVYITWSESENHNSAPCGQFMQNVRDKYISEA